MSFYVQMKEVETSPQKVELPSIRKLSQPDIERVSLPTSNLLRSPQPSSHSSWHSW
jgi:hypothetical protein